MEKKIAGVTLQKNYENCQRIGEGVCEDFWRIFKVFRSPKNKRFLDDQFKLLWPWPLLLYFDIENHFILSQKSVLDGDSQY